MEAIQDKIAAWLPQNLLEELRSKKTAAAPNAQPWVLEVSRSSFQFNLNIKNLIS